MGDVIYLPKRITHRYCPNCWHVIEQIVIEQANANFSCPRCNSTQFSDFKPVKDKRL